MQKLPQNLAELPTEQRFHFVFTNPTFVVPGDMIIDIDISAELRQAQNLPEIMEIRLTQIADNVLPEWYAHAIVGTAYQWAMTKANYQALPDQDRGRVILRSSDFRNRRISTPTVNISRLPDAVVQTISTVMQSNESCNVNRECQALVQIMAAARGGSGHRLARQINTSTHMYFANKTLFDPDWVQPRGMNMCMTLAIMMAPVRHIDETTGELQILDCLERPGFGDHVCANVMQRVGLTHNHPNEQIMQAFSQMWPNYRAEIQRLEERLRAMHVNIPNPWQWTEQHLSAIADILKVTIHVVAFEVGTMEVLRVGDEHKWDHIYILRSDGHYFAVNKPHILFLNNKRSGRYSSNLNPQKFCDRCLATTINKGAEHRLRCMSRPVEEKTIKLLYRKRLQSQMRSPFEEYHERWGFGKLGWCHTCNSAIGLIKPPTAEELGVVPVGMDFYRDMLWTMKNMEDEERYEWCRSRGHELEAMSFKVCSTCKAPVPTPYGYKERYKYMNDHVCSCERPRLRIGAEDKYWVWDLECLQRPVAGVVELPPILVCACNLSNPDLRLEFAGPDCMDRFMDTILGPAFKDTTWIAHNGASFDVQYVCRWLHAHGLNYQHTTSPGSAHSYQEVKYQHLRFIDSVKFIPMPLSAFGKTFGLQVAKGDFPLRFAIQEHLDYEGPIPPIDTPEDWYNLAMRGKASSPEESKSEIDKFREWYTEESQKYWTPEHPERPKWKFWEQLKRYCWLDVEVLRQGCQIYRNEFLSPSTVIDGWTCNPVDPFQYMTMPQMLQALFLNGLPPHEEIAAVPRIPKIQARQSAKALQWLLSCQNKLRIELGDPELQIRHIYNSPQGREYYVGLPDETYQALDGYLNFCGREYFFQFYGCYWHGCPTCFAQKQADMHPHKNVPFREVYEFTMRRSEQLRDAYPDATIVEIWEHDFDEEVLHADLCDEVQEKYPFSLFETRVMSDRDVFFGGRVEVFDNMSIANLEAGEEIRYIDVVSHYPNICAFYRLCTGHPQRLLGPEINPHRLKPENPDRYFGYFRGRIRPNPHDRFGGLPKKIGPNGTLVFSNLEDEYCGFLEELYERMEHGAQIVQMYEVLHFDEGNSRVGPFRGYIAKFFRDKMEASGWDDLARDTPFEHQELTEDLKQQLAGYLYGQNKELCILRPERVELNKGKRYIAKLCINSIWGKFVQKDVLKEKIRVTTSEEYFQIMNDDHIEPTSVQFNFLASGMYECSFEWTEEFVQRGSKINPYLGASVTGWARVILHQQIRMTEAIYCDTDSVIYKHIPGRTELTNIGAGIGQWQNEFDGVKVERFYALGPKCYCLVFNQPDKNGARYKIKAKGITMHASNHAILSPDDFLRTILANFDSNIPYGAPGALPRITLEHFHIGKDIFNRTGQQDHNVPIIAIHTHKDLRCTFNKRTPVRFYENDYLTLDDLMENAAQLFDRLTTVPLGYGGNRANIHLLLEQLSHREYPRYYKEIEWQRTLYEAADIIDDLPVSSYVA